MCNELGIPELLESRILGIPVVAIVTSRTRSLRDPTQQDFILHDNFMSFAWFLLKTSHHTIHKV